MCVWVLLKVKVYNYVLTAVSFSCIFDMPYGDLGHGVGGVSIDLD